MRVFILCTGRSGSTTIIKACSYIDNYTSSHESLSRLFGEKRFGYPDDHIEADNRLSWHLGHLNKLYADDAFYIHLKRNRDKTAQSFFKRFHTPGSIIDAFCEGIRMTPTEKISEEIRMQVCYDYVDTINANIEHFLSDKSKIMVINLENIEEDFVKFWTKIGAKGNLKLALNELKQKHNSSKKRSSNYKYKLKLFAMEKWRNITTFIKP